MKEAFKNGNGVNKGNKQPFSKQAPAVNAKPQQQVKAQAGGKKVVAKEESDDDEDEDDEDEDDEDEDDDDDDEDGINILKKFFK